MPRSLFPIKIRLANYISMIFNVYGRTYNIHSCHSITRQKQRGSTEATVTLVLLVVLRFEQHRSITAVASA